MVKIVHILPKFDTGGAEKFCVDMCNTLAADPENEVSLVILGTIDDDEILAKQVDQSCVNLIPLNKQGKSLKVIYDLYALLKKIDPDVSHTHLRAQAYGALPLILSGVPNIHTIHNLANKEIGSKIRSLYRFLYRRFNFTPVSISEEVLHSTKEEYGEQFDVKIDNGAKAVEKSDAFDEVKAYMDGLRVTDKTKVLLSIGRVSDQKNYLMMIDAFEELLDEGVDVQVVVIGSLTNDKPYADRCLERLKREDRIHFIAERSNIGDYMHACDAFFLSSLYEGLPISVLEAMSAGKPTLSTPVGGMVDIIQEGVNGYLSHDSSKEAFKALIRRYLEDDSFEPQAIRKIFDENFSIQNTANRYLELYRKVAV